MDKFRKTYFFDKHRNFYYEGMHLYLYDMHGTLLEEVVINKFILHYEKITKKPYICVNVNSLEYKTKNFTCNVDKIGTLLRRIDN